MSKPSLIEVRGEHYRAAVLKVLSQDALGRPKLCQLIPDDEETPLKSGDRFVVVYAPERAVLPKSRGDA